LTSSSAVFSVAQVALEVQLEVPVRLVVLETFWVARPERQRARLEALVPLEVLTDFLLVLVQVVQTLLRALAQLVRLHPPLLAALL
jgi:hypothetical protein